MLNKKGIILGIVIALALVAAFTNGFGIFTNTDITNNPVDIPIGNSPVIGNPNASVTIVIFSDFSCPYCAAAEGYNAAAIQALRSRDSSWQAPMPLIKSKYVDTGKVKLVFKYFPGHGSGKAAHLIAWSLNEQGKFWEFGELSFANQEKTGNFDAMKALAVQVGANMTKLQADLDSGKYNYKFEEDKQLGLDSGVQGTPTFFVNGIKIEGAQSFSEFDKLIQSKLK